MPRDPEVQLQLDIGKRSSAQSTGNPPARQDRSIVGELADTGRLLTVKEVALHCQVSEKTIRRAIESGHLRSCRPGHSIRIRRPDLEAWLAPAAGSSS